MRKFQCSVFVICVEAIIAIFVYIKYAHMTTTQQNRSHQTVKNKRLIVINEIRQISQNSPKQGPKFCKLQEAIWLTVINEIFIFPPRLGPFCQINYLSELFSGYPSYPIQK